MLKLQCGFPRTNKEKFPWNRSRTTFQAKPVFGSSKTRFREYGRRRQWLLRFKVLSLTLLRRPRNPATQSSARHEGRALHILVANAGMSKAGAIDDLHRRRLRRQPKEPWKPSARTGHPP